jgi:tRNA U34 5-carboxymethylaminomethyl modifying GTPase MnmE/TrmE
MEGLKDYQRRWLELGDMLRAALHIARGYRDQETEQEVRQLLSRLAADRFAVAVVGQFSRGKSTLMNALLGADYLPMGALPMTSVVTTVRYGSRPWAEAGFLADELRHGGKLFLVINKLDLVSARDAAEVTEFVRRWLGEHSAGRQPQLFTLSALEGLEAAVQDDRERLARSGILPFRAALTEFLTTEKSRTSLRNVTARAAGLMLGQQRDLRLGQARGRRQPGPGDRVGGL